jgi:polyphosphate kinase 2 (PPK2 family)
MSRLDDVDLSERLGKEDGEKKLAKLQKRLLEARLELGGLLGDGSLGPPLCVVFEGWDASGKGGAIKRLVAQLDPRHVTVAQFAAPTPREKRHHFLWRFWPALPGRGGMCVFDRSWYGRVLVERVEGFATEAEWKRAYGEIVSFEDGLCRDGMILVKLWMHISPEEQLRRFQEREKSELKRWKLTDEDWRNREKRPAYEKAVQEMLDQTDHELAPWHVIPGDSKALARVRVVETVLDAIARSR